jgi:hypothetical protein
MQLLPPILLPEVRDFAALLEYHGEWSHQWPRDPATNATIAPVEPRYLSSRETPIGRTMGAILDIGGLSRDHDALNEIGPFCSVDLSQLGGPAHRSMAVRATDLVLDTVRPRIVTDDDHLGFRIIGHHGDGRALVILQHGHITGSHWLARIDPATIPAYPFAARDAAIAEVRAEIEAATGWVACMKPYPDHSVDYGYDGVKGADGRVKRPPRPIMVARIDASGTVERRAPLPS